MELLLVHLRFVNSSQQIIYSLFYFSLLLQFLRTMNPQLKVVAVEPEESAVLSGQNPGPHKIQGIGAGFIPKNCDLSLIDQIIKVSSAKSIETARNIATKEGVFVGISSGAALTAAMEVSKICLIYTLIVVKHISIILTITHSWVQWKRMLARISW